MRFSVVAALIAPVGLVVAAPASQPGKRETNLGNACSVVGPVGNEICAALFGAGDTALNNPLDAVTNALQNPGNAPAQTVNSLMRSGTNFVKSLENILTAGFNSAAKPATTPVAKAN